MDVENLKKLLKSNNLKPNFTYGLFCRMLEDVFLVKGIGKWENDDSQEDDYNYEAF